VKIAFFSESPSDQAALAVFAEGLLGEPPEPFNGMDLQGRSVSEVLSTLYGVFRGVHFHSDAQALVVVVDSDDTELHDPAHDAPEDGGRRCRLCEIRKIIEQARQHLGPRQGRPELKVAVGLAVPAIEAWYLVGKKHEVGEAAWKVGLSEGRRPFNRKQLKEWVYGTNRPSLELETKRAKEEAYRIIRDIKAIESSFPNGFGAMAQEIRSWAAQQPKPAAE
jgi:hypothetical protein